jgi:hypothetical protein
MVYIEPEQMGWQPMLRSWLAANASRLSTEHSKMVADLAQWLFRPLLAFLRRNCTEAVPTADPNLPQTALRLFDAAVADVGTEVLAGHKVDVILQGLFVMGTIWSFGGAVDRKVMPSYVACIGLVACLPIETHVPTANLKLLWAVLRLIGAIMDDACWPQG